MCTVLWCTKPDGSCSTNEEPAATGTSCGQGKVRRKEIPNIVLIIPSICQKAAFIAYTLYENQFWREALHFEFPAKRVWRELGAPN